MGLKAVVTQVKRVPKGGTVGYGRAFRAERDSVIATLPIGYGDGYNRLLSNGRGQVLLRGRRAPIAGRVCMDQCMADVTGIPGVREGDVAVLLGAQGADAVTCDEMSALLGTINYEVTCRIDRRVPRVYMRGGAPAFVARGLP
jgi:alanine racemase